MVYVLSLAGQLTALNTNVELTDGVDQSSVVKIVPDGVSHIESEYYLKLKFVESFTPLYS